MEVAIRTYHFGLVFAMVVFAAFALCFASLDTASAAATGIKKTSTAQGVRNNTSYQRRQPVAKKSSKSYVKTKKVSTASYKKVALPKENASDMTTSEIAYRAGQLVGARYRWGGMSPSTGFDCTGLVHYVYGGKAGYLPRTSQGMYQSISKTAEIRPGDILFFGRGRVRHAAIYKGNGKIIHASTPQTGVREDSFQTIASYMGYIGAGRI